MEKMSLKACRVNANLTQMEVAHIMDVDISTIRNWESGKTSPTVVQGFKLCELYHVDIGSVNFFCSND